MSSVATISLLSPRSAATPLPVRRKILAATRGHGTRSRADHAGRIGLECVGCGIVVERGSVCPSLRVREFLAVLLDEEKRLARCPVPSLKKAPSVLFFGFHSIFAILSRRGKGASKMLGTPGSVSVDHRGIGNLSPSADRQSDWTGDNLPVLKFPKPEKCESIWHA